MIDVTCLFLLVATGHNEPCSKARAKIGFFPTKQKNVSDSTSDCFVRKPSSSILPKIDYPSGDRAFAERPMMNHITRVIYASSSVASSPVASSSTFSMSRSRSAINEYHLMTRLMSPM